MLHHSGMMNVADAIAGVVSIITYMHRHDEAYENHRTPVIAPSLYPAGFSPLETSEKNNYAATLDLKGDNFVGFDWDLDFAGRFEHYTDVGNYGKRQGLGPL
ncbi:hypothetical protein GKA01_26720 [Gluconobacter kanchanaburiensis NBRC 103587]|uniref:TonB-dependent receptor-like beta-barrel domain-containing protein n=1 Tax=Gluconobacter kanchanaburiensis NBRC 103587 TaxID=1307948 RepID=A0A511BAP6_9PROT|nr:hypothetical protein GKA01_26720 [Gluconobacter kanchanaburiensis NBRC 103587]